VKEGEDSLKGDEGLVLDAEAKHYGLAAKFAKVLDNTGKSLVIQYH